MFQEGEINEQGLSKQLLFLSGPCPDIEQRSTRGEMRMGCQ